MKRRLTSRLPSVGFVLVIASLVVVAAFVMWIAGEDWYDRLGKPMDRETRKKTLSDYSDYLEGIAPRTRSKGAGIEAVRKAVRLRKQIGDEAGERRALAILEEMTGEQVFSVQKRGIAEDGWTLAKESQITINNQSTTPLSRILRLGYLFRTPNMPIGVTVRRGAEITKFEFDEPGFEHLELTLEPGETETVVVTTDALFTLDGDSRAVGIFVEVVEAAGLATVQTSGVTHDGWTLDGAPGLIRVMNPSVEPICQYLELRYHVPTPSMPTVVRVVEDCDEGALCDEQAFTFTGAQVERYFFTVGAQKTKSLRILCDETFTAVDDDRNLGVQVKVVNAPPVDAIVTRGLYRDGWTKKNRPAFVTIRNITEESIRRRLVLRHWRDDPIMPITVTVKGPGFGEGAHYVFERAGSREIDLVVGPGREHTWEISTDKFIQTEGDKRGIGVNVKLLDQGQGQ